MPCGVEAGRAPLLQAQRRQGCPEARGAEGREASPRWVGRVQPCPLLDLGLLASRAEPEQMPVPGLLLQAPQSQRLCLGSPGPHTGRGPPVRTPALHGRGRTSRGSQNSGRVLPSGHLGALRGWVGTGRALEGTGGRTGPGAHCRGGGGDGGREMTQDSAACPGAGKDGAAPLSFQRTRLVAPGL